MDIKQFNTFPTESQAHPTCAKTTRGQGGKGAKKNSFSIAPLLPCPLAICAYYPYEGIKIRGKSAND